MNDQRDRWPLWQICCRHAPQHSASDAAQQDKWARLSRARRLLKRLLAAMQEDLPGLAGERATASGGGLIL